MNIYLFWEPHETRKFKILIAKAGGKYSYHRDLRG
jgi:hypothetical protein